MGSATSTLTAAARRLTRRQDIRSSKARLQQASAKSSALARYDPNSSQLVQNLSNTMAVQLDRHGKPFTKNDLYAILTHFSGLRGQGIESLAELRNCTCEDLRARIRIAIYTSDETLQALEKVANPRSQSFVPVATQIDPSSSSSSSSSSGKFE
jgi:type VI protein secretion system component VasK